MKVFLAGGTGVLGRRVVADLVRSGHEVTAMARSEAKAAQLAAAGAVPVRCSLFEPDGLRAAVAGHDAVVNVATHIPPVSTAARASAWAENTRVRTEGARNLVDAALVAGVGRYVQESIAFLYADRGDDWIDEDTPLVDPPVDASAAVVAAEGEAARFTAAGGTGVVLRFGMFHAADSAHTRSMLLATRWGCSPLPGPERLYLPIIHVADAGAAVVAALDAPAGTWNVVGDEPPTRIGYARAFQGALDDPGRIRLLPGFVAWTMTKSVPQIGLSQRVSNRRFREATGWAPRYPSARETLAEIVPAAREPHRVRSQGAAVALLLLAASSLFIGLWALAAPGSFHGSFPGFGHVWVAPDGPFNEHLLRDVGAMYLALGVVAAGALVSMTIALVRTAALAHLVFGVPHLLYHATHLGPFGAADGVAMVGSLGLAVVLAVIVLVLSARRPSVVSTA